MRVFLTSDLHFGHKNIIEYEKRPFRNVEDMNAGIIKNWNKIVSNDDMVFCLGDVSFGGAEMTKECVSQLQGKKILIMGNHDRGRSISWWMDKGFDEVYRYPIMYNGFLILGHEPPDYMSDATPYYFAYGHVHGSEMYKTLTKRSVCVCVERWGMAPVELSRIEELWKVYS